MEVLQKRARWNRRWNNGNFKLLVAVMHNEGNPPSNIYIYSSELPTATHGNETR
jgi:hypothetical protein